MILASFWGGLGVFLTLLGGFGFFVVAKTGHFGGFGSKTGVETLNPYLTRAFRAIDSEGARSNGHE